MTEILLAAILAGLAAGVVHALTGPDHLAVVAPLAADPPARSWRTGARWGLGHALGVGLVGAAAVLFREALPLGALESWSERLVGGSLVAVGLWALLSALRHDAGSRKGARGGGAALAVGTLHGTAGGSHLVGILPALALSSAVAATAYVLAFAAGTLVAMSGFAWLVGWGGERTDRLGRRARASFVGACAGASIAVGFVWLAA